MKIFSRKGKGTYNRMVSRIKDLHTKYLFNNKRTAGMHQTKIGYIKASLLKIIAAIRF